MLTAQYFVWWLCLVPVALPRLHDHAGLLRSMLAGRESAFLGPWPWTYLNQSSRGLRKYREFHSRHRDPTNNFFWDPPCLGPLNHNAGSLCRTVFGACAWFFSFRGAPSVPDLKIRLANQKLGVGFHGRTGTTPLRTT